VSSTDDVDPLPRIDRRRVVDLCPHPQADEVPELGEGEHRALEAEIAERGLQVPLEVTREGTLLDGHARLRAPGDIAVAHLEVLTPGDEPGHILLAALSRRQRGNTSRLRLAAVKAPLAMAHGEEVRTRVAVGARAGAADNGNVSFSLLFLSRGASS
jgi:hypothetical protein